MFNKLDSPLCHELKFTLVEQCNMIIYLTEFYTNRDDHDDDEGSINHVEPEGSSADRVLCNISEDWIFNWKSK